MPTALQMPWPSGPVETSMAGWRMFSGWPAVTASSLRKRFSSSMVMPS
jgi:hypothetical protein